MITKIYVLLIFITFTLVASLAIFETMMTGDKFATTVRYMKIRNIIALVLSILYIFKIILSIKLDNTLYIVYNSLCALVLCFITASIYKTLKKLI